METVAAGEKGAAKPCFFLKDSERNESTEGERSEIDFFPFAKALLRILFLSHFFFLFFSSRRLILCVI